MNPINTTVLIVMALFILEGCSSGNRCRKIVTEKCTSCHSIDTSCQQEEKSRKYWEVTVDQMIRLNASISDKEKKKLVRCLGKSRNLSELCEK